MSDGPSAAGTARRVGSGTARMARAWRALPHESRLAAFACAALFVALFLPWYQVTLIARAKTATLQSASATITGWGALSFVEAAVLLVAFGVVALLFQRAEGRAFHLPGGDGGVITAAGLWTCLLIVWRIFDKQGAVTRGPAATTSGIEWGIFVALAVAGVLTYAGTRIRRAHEPEPPLPGDTPRRSRRPDMEADDTWTQAPAPVTTPTLPRARPRRAPAAAEKSKPAPDAGPARRRLRPKSVAEGLPPESPRPQRSRPLDRRSIEELDIADPPPRVWPGPSR
jgi:hypothetical protein